MKKSTVLFVSSCMLAGVYGSKKWLKKPMFGKVLSAFGVAVVATAPAYAINEQSMQAYAMSMKASANAQNISQIAKLIDDDAVISITRHGKTSTLDKNAYLQLLQKSWAGSTNYYYDITMSDVVVAGDQVRAVVNTVESWEKDGKKTTVNTTSKATLVQSGSDMTLLRAVSQIVIE
ncbi:hypothetical protein [Moraxella oblonga]|uniref:hypothetical protein n=1 Tax=Moraxella oblonga TaxID=200413 RepID=UPI00082E0206|nr:hypothetical protein [Moraxella oblonga]